MIPSSKIPLRMFWSSPGAVHARVRLSFLGHWSRGLADSSGLSSGGLELADARSIALMEPATPAVGNTGNILAHVKGPRLGNSSPEYDTCRACTNFGKRQSGRLKGCVVQENVDVVGQFFQRLRLGVVDASTMFGT